MIYPNLACYYLCVWMLTISKQRLTGPQITLTETIRDAALTETGVTETEWNNFNQYAAWRNPYYLVYRDYQTVLNTDLLTDIFAYYKFQGNSNDSVASLNGTDSAVTYSTSYGKIDQGVQNNSTSGYIELGSVSDFSFIQNTCDFTINFWYKTSNTTGTYRLMGSTGTSAAKGIYIEIKNSGVLSFYIYNGSSNSYNLFGVELGQFLKTTSYNMYSFVGDGTYIYIYLNGMLRLKAPIGTLSSGSSSNKLRIMYINTIGGSTTCNMDELGFWTRGLNIAEIAVLYNNGAGITYPF